MSKRCVLLFSHSARPATMYYYVKAWGGGFQTLTRTPPPHAKARKSSRGGFGAILGHVGPSWPILAHLGASLGPSWAILVPSWGHLGPSWDRLGTVLGNLGAVLGGPWGVLGVPGGSLGVP